MRSFSMRNIPLKGSGLKPPVLFLRTCRFSEGLCTACRTSGHCLRSPDALSGWECSRFSMTPPTSNTTLLRLQYLQCALGVNDLVLHAQYAAFQADYHKQMGECIVSKFSANGGRSEKPDFSFTCPASPTYRQFCSDLRGSMCTVAGYMSNWLSFPAGALVANFTGETCVPSACRELAYDPTIYSLFNPDVEAAFCANATQLDLPTGDCFTQIQCTPPQSPKKTVVSELVMNNYMDIGIVAGLATIAGLLLVGLLVIFIKRKR